MNSFFLQKQKQEIIYMPAKWKPLMWTACKKI